jgi:chorismate mutase/prephenate dehydratase
MTRIESRPSKRRAWAYFFFVDVKGHAEEPRLARAIAGLHRSCSFVKVLGSYPDAG